MFIRTHNAKKINIRVLDKNRLFKKNYKYRLKTKIMFKLVYLNNGVDMATSLIFFFKLMSYLLTMS